MARSLSCGSALEIASSGLVAKLCPEMGGRLLELRTREFYVVVPSSPHSFEVTAWPRAGAYPLIPYHNRISDARISVGSGEVVLAAHPAATPHTLHGPSHTRAWSLESHERSSLTMSLDYAPDEHWPWAFRALQSYHLEGSELMLRLSLENLSKVPMPAGLGWHPYFSSTDPVHTDAKSSWPHRDDYLPTGERRDVVDESTESTAPTRYLEGWSKAAVNLTGGGQAVLSASSEFDFLVIHRGDKSHICIEPVTHVANAWNLGSDRPSVGARVLEPGGILQGSISVQIIA